MATLSILSNDSGPLNDCFFQARLLGSQTLQKMLAKRMVARYSVNVFPYLPLSAALESGHLSGFLRRQSVP